MSYGHKVEIARKYRKEYGVEMPTRKLARIMYKENNLLFKDEEEARERLRYIEGKAGNKKNKEYIKKTEFFVEGARPKNPYALPESDEESYEPYIIQGHKRVLIINDIHLPYHNQQAITACFDFAKKQKPDAIFINGDLLDFHGISFFEKDPRKKHFAAELKMFKQFFEILERTFKCKIYFKFGNHEERYNKFLFQKAKELVGVEEFELENIIKARAEGIEVITDKRIVMMNELPFIHGHEFGRGVFSPVNSARGLFLQAKHSCVKGDSHVTSEHTEPNILGKIMTTWSVGCLCGMTPRWLPLNKWNAGFGIANLDSNGTDFEFINKRIFKGRVL
jgi:predicted phosphodiesterase